MKIPLTKIISIHHKIPDEFQKQTYSADSLCTKIK